MMELTKTTQAGCRTIIEAIGTCEIKRHGSISYEKGGRGAIHYVEVDFDEDWIVHASATLSSPDKRILQDVRNAIEAIFESGDCGCSHDMCRCVTHSAKAMQRWENEWDQWIVVVNEHNNFD